MHPSMLPEAILNSTDGCHLNNITFYLWPYIFASNCCIDSLIPFSGNIQIFNVESADDVAKILSWNGEKSKSVI